MARCIENKKVVETYASDFVRDYIGPAELLKLIDHILNNKGNRAYDLISAVPPTKSEIVRELATRFSLQYCVVDSVYNSIRSIKSPNSVAGIKTALEIGYVPERSSIEVIRQELAVLLNRQD
jgi:hypothetical protein